MTIWILALILVGGSVALGHKMGAVRAAITFAGIFFAMLLAGPLAGLARPLLPHMGVRNPIIAWIVPPLALFVVVLVIFKSIGSFVDRRITVHYKHHATELQWGWFERLNHRLGLCVGALNGLVYLVLAAVLIYNYSYWTVQMASSNREAAAIRLLNRAGRDLDATGMSSVARAVDPMPARYYKLADLAGLLYQNHDLKERLADYPAFLGLAERSDFKQLGKDEAFQEAWQGHAPLGELLNSPGAKAILDTPSVAGMVLAMVETNLDDLQTYLKTGKSPKYDSEPILGRWHVNVPASLAVETQSQTNMPLPAFQGLEALWERAYGNTRLVADARGEVFLDNMANIRTAPKRMPTVQMENESGQWTGDGLDYQFTFGGNKTAAGKTDGLRLRFIMAGKTLIFDR